MTEQRLSYTGERVYVGIDVHKVTYAVTCVCQRQIVKTATVPADPARLAESLLRWFPGATLSSATIHVKRDTQLSIAYSEELISSTISATLQSTDRHHGIVGQERCHFQLDS
jgi:hypothetical protein